VVPGGGINTQRTEWRKVKGNYLFNGFMLAAAFRGAMLKAIELSLLWVLSTPPPKKKWVVNYTKVGRRRLALKYLSRYLYRVVISTKNIVSDDGTYVTFCYTDSKSNTIKAKCVLGEEFMDFLL
jgi:hypothetical protein